jgi:hypothetical protein
VAPPLRFGADPPLLPPRWRPGDPPTRRAGATARRTVRGVKATERLRETDKSKFPGVSSGNYRFVVTQNPFRGLCDPCDSCYSCDSSPRTGVAPHAFRPHPSDAVPSALRDRDPTAAGAGRGVCGADSRCRRGQSRRGGAGTGWAGGPSRRAVRLRRGSAQDLEAPQRAGIREATRGLPDPACARQEPGSYGLAGARRTDLGDGRGRQAADEPSAGGERIRLGRRDLGAWRRGPGRRPQLRGAHPHARRVVDLDGPGLPRRPRPGPGQRGRPPRAARHRAAARRPGRRGAGARGRQAVPPQRHEPRGHRAGQAEGHGQPARGDRHQRPGRQGRVALGVRRTRPVGRGGGGGAR